ncbi:hypothetical protein HWV62_9527, partial [Athelia sp. TMB]
HMGRKSSKVQALKSSQPSPPTMTTTTIFGPHSTTLGAQDATRNRLASIDMQTKNIEVEKASLLSRSEELDAALKSLQAERKAIFNRIAPISYLPNEILAAIFETLHASLEDEHTALTTLSEVVVSHVTTHWRAVAIKASKLWTRIKFRSSQQSIGLLELYLQRSQRLPIDLFVEIDNSNTDSYNHLIRPHIGRCRHLSIYTDERADLIKQLNLLSTQSTPFLQSMDLLCSSTWRGLSQLDSNRPSGGAPNLSALRVRGAEIEDLFDPLYILQSIRMMWCEQIGPPVLHHAANLTHLTLAELQIYGGEYQSISTITLPRLLALSISIRDAEDGALSEFLMALDAPRLEVLHFCNIGETDTSPLWTSTHFPSLHILALDHDLSEFGLLALATSCPHITHLAYGDKVEDLQLLLKSSGVESGAQTATHWANLHTLYLDTPSAPGAVVEMLIARRNIGAPIRKLLVPIKVSLDFHAACSGHVEVEKMRDHLKALYPNWQDWNSGKWAD